MTSANFVDNSAANRSQNGKELKCIYKHGDAERNKTSPWILDRFAEFSGFFAFSCCTTRLLRCQPTTPPLLLIGSPFTASHAYATTSTVPPPVYHLTIQPSITSIPPTDTLPSRQLSADLPPTVDFLQLPTACIDPNLSDRSRRSSLLCCCCSAASS